MKGHSVAYLFRQNLSPLNPFKSILVLEEHMLTLRKSEYNSLLQVYGGEDWMQWQVAMQS